MAQSHFSKEKLNFLKVAEGLGESGRMLETYTMSGLATVHTNIHRRLASYKPCQHNCSRDYGANFRRWCATCRSWKNEFEAYIRDKNRFRNMSWKQMQSWMWPDRPECIAEVFLVKGWAKNAAKIEFNDLSTALSLWKNCTVYNIQPNTIDKLRETRNSLFAHNAKMVVSDHKLTTTFNALNVLFQDNDLKNSIDVQKCLQALDNILQKTHIEIYHKEILDNLERKIQTQADRLNEAILQFKNLPETRKPTVLVEQKVSQKHTRKSPLYQYIGVCIYVGVCIGIAAVIYVMLQGQPEHKSELEIMTGCVAESYSVPFTPELQLEGYLTSSDNFVGRTWLVRKVKSTLLRSDTKQKGILATADMGYGKSAFVTHLLCSNKSKSINNMKSKIIAYHVCKFDVLSTKNPALFIRRVVGMVSRRVPELGNVLSLMPNTSMLFDRQLCEQDPIGCFDQGLLFPIRNVHSQQKNFL